VSLKNNKYEEKILELRQILLNSGFDKEKWGKCAVDIILITAMVNMHIPQEELIELYKKFLEKIEGIRNHDTDSFKIALINLKENDILWQCDKCKGIDCRAKREKMNDFCLRDIDFVVGNLERYGYKFYGQKKKLLKGLEMISSHGLKRIGEVKGVWELAKDGMMNIKEVDNRLNNQFIVEHFDKLIDSKLQNKTISMLKSATKEIKIVSTYGQWVAKDDFKRIIDGKIRDRIKVKLIVDTPTAIGTNCRKEWQKWNDIHKKMKIKPKECWLNYYDNRNYCVNITMVDNKKAIAFLRNLYGLTLLGSIYTDYPPNIEQLNDIFRKYEENTFLVNKIKGFLNEFYTNNKHAIFVSIITAIIGFLYKGIIGIIIGILLGYFVAEVIRKIFWK
jgi:hypothetical protein